MSFARREYGLGPRLVVVCALTLGGCERVSARVVENPSEWITASGRLDSHSEARHLTAERDAVIEAIRTEPGARVTAGEVLVELSCDDARARLAAALGRERAARAALALAEAGPLESELRAADAAAKAEQARTEEALDRLKRAEQLHQRSVLSDGAVTQQRRETETQRWLAERAHAAFDRVRHGARAEERQVAAAEVQIAEAAVLEARADVARCVVTAPIDGVVLRVLRREGEFSGASQGTVLVVMADTSKMVARAEIDERDAPRVRVGMPAEVWTEGSPARHRGRIVELAAAMGRRTARSLDPADRFDRETLEAIIELPEPDVPRLVGLRVVVGIRNGDEHASR